MKFVRLFFWISSLISLLFLCVFIANGAPFFASLSMLGSALLLMPPLRARLAHYFPGVAAIALFLVACLLVAQHNDAEANRLGFASGSDYLEAREHQLADQNELALWREKEKQKATDETNYQRMKQVADAGDADREADRVRQVQYNAQMSANTSTDRTAIPNPSHSIEECRRAGDASCTKGAWNEYKNAILNEFDEWNTLLPIAERGDSDAANRALAIPMRNGWYVHNHWVPIVPKADEFDIVTFDAAEAVDACRVAIINLKFWLIALSDKPSRVSDEPSSYRRSASECRRGKKRLHL